MEEGHSKIRVEAPDSALPFVVHQHADWMFLRFDYGKPRTWHQIVIRDPVGRTRYSHLDVIEPRTVLLHRDPYLTGVTAVSGDIIPGTWTVEFLRKFPVEFEIEWETGSGNVPLELYTHDMDLDIWCEGVGAGQNVFLNHYSWEKCKLPVRRWYKGNLHGHTTLSDGLLSPREITRQAETKGLEFFFVTEHNVFPSYWPKGRPLVIPGMEFTSFGKGDWNALGLTGWIDCWGAGSEDGGMHAQEGQNRLMEEAGSMGAVRTFNHPLAGRFAWRFPDSPLRYVDLLEKWNSPTKTSTPALTEQTMVLWNTLWNDGYRVPGVGGSDTHLRPDQSYEEGCPPDSIGDPSSYVLADRLTPEDILNGLRAGHVYVSRGPELEVTFRVGERTFAFGDDLTEELDVTKDGLVRSDWTVTHAEGSQLRVIENGSIMETYDIGTDHCSFEMEFSWKDREYAWRRFELRDSDGELLCFTNPVSYGSKQISLFTWGQLLEKAGIVLH